MIGNLLLLKCKGSPMEVDPAPFWANLYCYDHSFWLEADFKSELIKTDKPTAIKSKNASSFIHRLQATFFNLDVAFVKDIYKCKLYEKITIHPFFVWRPNLSDSTPAYAFYGSILSDFLRIAKCISKFFVAKA